MSIYVHNGFMTTQQTLRPETENLPGNLLGNLLGNDSGAGADCCTPAGLPALSAEDAQQPGAGLQGAR